MGRGWQRAADREEAKNYEGVELLRKALQLRSVELLFAVDKLMSELVAPPGASHGGVSRVITLAPLNAFDRKLVHIMAERYGLKTESHSGTIIRYPACCTCCDVEIDLKRVVISWTPTAHPPSELIGDMYFALKGKRSQLDTSDRKGNYRYATNCYKPVWEKRRLQSDNGDEDAEAETAALTTAFNSGFPPELLLAIFAFLPCRDLVCAGLVCKEWNAVSLEPSLWRMLCMAKLQDKGEYGERENEECQKATKKDDKEGERMDEATWARVRDLQQWRECYVAHYWQWTDATPGGKWKNRHRFRLQHSHSFLGSKLCQQPHL